MKAENTLTSVELEDLQALAGYLREHNLMLATAESCTAGMIASLLADIPGAGQLLDCAFTTYSVEAKKRCLDVPDDVLEQNNLTSEPVARAMAEGAARHSRANVVVSNTGVADSGGTGVEPGTQCYAWLFKLGGDGEKARQVLHTETRRFPGNRAAVRRASALYALSRIAHYHAMHADAEPPPTTA